MVQKPSASPRLLIVDGHEEDRTRLRRRLTGQGCEVFEAADGERAAPLMRMLPLDLVLLAAELPDGDGLALLRRLRDDEGRTDLPIIVLGARADGAAVAEVLGLGADDYVTRPLDVEAACARSVLQIRRKRERDAARADRRDLEESLAKLRSAASQAEDASALLAAARRQGRGEPGGVARKARLRVLSTADDAQSRFAMRAALRAGRAEVELVDVASGLQAALAAETAAFDLILVDVLTAEALPGIRAIRRMERQARLPATPILAIGADAQAAARALQAGADLHLAQPLAAEDLLAALPGRRPAPLRAVA